MGNKKRKRWNTRSRILSILLAVCMVFGLISYPVAAADLSDGTADEILEEGTERFGATEADGEQAGVLSEGADSVIIEETEPDTSEGNAVKVITAFTELDTSVREQKIAVGTPKSGLNLPDTLTAAAERISDAIVSDTTEELTVEGVTWELDPENSVKDTFDAGQTPEQYFGVNADGSSKYAEATEEEKAVYESTRNMNGAYYTYVAVISEEYTLADGVELPQITVTVGQEAERPAMLANEQFPITVDKGETYTIARGESLTIPSGATMTVDGMLVNNGTLTIEDGGTLTGSGWLQYSWYLNDGMTTPEGTITGIHSLKMAPSIAIWDETLGFDDPKQCRVYAWGNPITIEGRSFSEISSTGTYNCELDKVTWNDGTDTVSLDFDPLTDGIQETIDFTEYDILVYGAVDNADANNPVKSTNITMNGGCVHEIFGGGGGRNVSGDTHVTINGGFVNGTLYGNNYGGINSGTVGGSTYVTVKGGLVNAFNSDDMSGIKVDSSTNAYICEENVMQSHTFDYLIFNNLLYKTKDNNYITKGDVTIPTGETLTIEDGKTFTLNGGLTAASNDQLVNNGGTLKTTVLKDDYIQSIPDQVYTGSAIEPDITLTATILGQEFEVDAAGYTRSFENNTNVGTATVKYTKNDDETTVFSKTFEIIKSATGFEGGVKAYNGTTEKSTFAYGDTITVKAKPQATGEAPQTYGLLRSAAPAAPNANQMALYVTKDGEETQISAAADADEDGVYTMTYETKEKDLAIGENTIIAKYVESDNMAAAEGSVSITLNQKEISGTPAMNSTKPYDGTNAFSGVSLTLTNTIEGDAVSAAADVTTADANPGKAKPFTAVTITLSGADSGYYHLATSAVSGTVEITAAMDEGAYQIRDAAGLLWFAEYVNQGGENLTADAALTADIDLSAVCSAALGSWTPIGKNAANAYQGIFNGNGYEVTGLYIGDATATGQGLFGFVSNAAISDLSVSGSISLKADTASVSKTGGVVGCAGGATTLSGLTSSVAITGTAGSGQQLKHIGGVLGGTDSGSVTVTKCAFNGEITLQGTVDCAGGIMGYINGTARMENCLNTGAVSTDNSSDNCTGGLLGYVNHSAVKMTNCLNTGTVNGKTAGAVIGMAKANTTPANITGCYYLDSSSVSGLGSDATTGKITTTALTAAQLQSGEAAYLLNGSTSDGELAWYQTIGSDELPVFVKADGNTVYQVNVNEGGVTTKGYSNTNEDIIVKMDVTGDMLAYTAPVNLVADETAKEATVTAAAGITGLGAITVKYQAAGTEAYLENPPTAVGTYDVYVSVAEGEYYLASTADIKVGSFTVVLANTIETVAESISKDYTGSPVEISTEKGTDIRWDGTGTATIEGYYTDENCTTQTTAANSGIATGAAEGSAPVKAGTYYAKVNVTADSEYAAASAVIAFKITVSYESLQTLMQTVQTNLDDGTYGEASYTTASIAKLRDALKAAEKIEKASSDADILKAYQDLQVASTVGADGLVAKAYTVTLKADPVTGGKLSGGGSLGAEEDASIVAVPATGYRFDGWYEGTVTTGDAVATDKSWTITAGTEDVTYTAKFTQINSLSIKTIGNGTVYCNDSSVSEEYTANIAVGTKIVLKAVAKDGYEFVYWMDKNNRILSYTADSYTTYVGSETQIQAVFQATTKTQDSKWNYRFLNKNGNIVSSSNAVEGSTITAPVSNPFLIGYTFKGWKVKGTSDTELVEFATFTITGNTVFEAVFEKDTEVTYAVTVIGGTISGTDTTTGNYAFDTRITVVADTAPDGQVFSYWKNGNDEIVSYDESYRFSVGGDTSVTAVFEETAAEELPTIVGVITNVDTNNNRISFLFDRTMPEGYTFIQTGCIATDDATLGSSKDNFVLGADAIDFTKVASSMNGTGQYMWTKSNISATWYVRGYLTYKDAKGISTTIYTDILTGSLSE